MRVLSLAVITLAGLGLSGCSQISNLWKKSDSTDASAQQAEVLRTTPQQAYQFEEEIYAVDVYDDATQYASIQPASTQYSSAQYTGSPFAGYAVEIFNPQSGYTSAYSDPRETEFVMLNGDSNIADWQNCETLNRGYIYASEYEFTLNPDFEVCMRNKGYVMATEYGSSSKQVLNAETARLRGPVQFNQTSSSYPGYFR